ncbi:MAG: hypothetical protein WA208_09045 [Thermoanaerobaculia bacterium]
MFEDWISNAAKRSLAVAIEFDRILDAHRIVSAAVGTIWLADQERRLHLGGRTVADAHPLHRALAATTDTAIAEVCELSQYLGAFQNDPALNAVIQDLRTDKYDAVLQELAFAYRWQAGGAAVSLRPATPTGEADFQATIDGLAFTVETSLFPSDVTKDLRFRLPLVISDAIDAAAPLDRSITLKFRLDTLPPGNVEAEVRAWTKSAVSNFQSHGVAEFRNEHVAISVELTTSESEGNPFELDEYRRVVSARDHEWNLFFRHVTREQPEGLPLHRLSEGREVAEKARIFAKFPIPEVDPVRDIMRKVRKEVRQLSGIVGPRVVILDASLYGDVNDLRSGALESEFLRLMRNIPELAAVFVTMRRWTTALRFKYFSIFAPNPHSIYQIPACFMQRMAMKDWKWDFVGNHEYPDLGPKEAARYYADRVPPPG